MGKEGEGGKMYAEGEVSSQPSKRMYGQEARSTMTWVKPRFVSMSFSKKRSSSEIKLSKVGSSSVRIR